MKAMSRIGKCASAVLIVLGLLLSAYLVARSFWLLENADAAGGDVCSMVFGKGCDATLRSSSSWLLGIPLGGWGLVYFTTLAGLLMLGAALGEGFQHEAITSALALGCLGAVASIVLTA